MTAYISIALGIGIISTAFFIYIADLIENRGKFKIRNSLNSIYIEQKDEITKWIDSIDKTMKKNNLKIKTRKLLLVNTLCSIISFFIGLNIFKNFTASVFMALSFFIIPEYLLYLYQDLRKKKIEDEMVTAIRIFSTEFIQVRSVEKAFVAIANRVVDPIGRYFNDAYLDFLRGIPLNSVLINLSQRVDSEYWKMFIQLIHQVNKNSQIINLFTDLTVKIEDQIELSRSNNSTLSGERVIALIMALLPVPAYFFMQRLIPETVEFITQSVAGRLFITISFLSLFIFLIIDRVIRRVD